MTRMNKVQYFSYHYSAITWGECQSEMFDFPCEETLLNQTLLTRKITVSMSIVCQKRDWQLRNATGTNSLISQFRCQALKQNSEGSVPIHGFVIGAALGCLTQRKVNQATNITMITISGRLLIQDPQHTVTRQTMPIKDDLAWWCFGCPN